MPKVTVVIPCYNHGRFLDKAVDSILAQTFVDYEIFVINDGSTDPFTIRKLETYKKPKTTVFTKKNEHLSAARNFGISRSKSDYILTLDSDDYFGPTFLEKAVAIMNGEANVGIVTSWCQTFGVVKRLVKHELKAGVKDFLAHNPCHASCLFRRRCWEEAGGYDETMREGYEDWNFNIAVTKRGWHVHAIPEVLFFYRVGNVSMVTGSDRIRPKLMGRLVKNHIELYRENVETVIAEEEKQIQVLEQKLDATRGSIAHRVGRAITDPAGIAK
ncbi:MAG: glycosyltransferase family 2 protein, partial [Limisphaerales bacterium]